MSKSTPVLTEDQLAAFRVAAYAVLAADAKHAATDDWDSSTRLLNELFYDSGLTHEEFERFAHIVTDAADPDFRCPK